MVEGRAMPRLLDELFRRLTDPRTYLTFGLVLAAYNGIGVLYLHSWGPVDLWEHLGTIDAIARSPLRPHDAFVASQTGSHLFTPYHLFWGLLARATSLKAHALMPAMAALNTVLFLFGVRAMTIRLTGHPGLATCFALTLLFFWLRPWAWSGFYNFGLLPLAAIYPYWFAFPLTLLFLGRLGTEAWKKRTLILYGAGVALVFLVHPLTGSFFALVLAIRGLVEPELSSTARRMRMAAAVGGLALALAWPYFSVPALIAAAPHFASRNVAGDWAGFYDKAPLRLLPASLGAVYYVTALRVGRWDWTGWSLVVVAVLYLLNPLGTRSALVARSVIYLAFLLHCGILRALSQAQPGNADAPTHRVPLGRDERGILVFYLIVLMGAAALECRSALGWWGAPWTLSSPSHAGDQGNAHVIRRFAAYEPYLGPSAVVMAGMEESWVIPATAGAHVVGVLHGGPYLPDFEERRTVVRRFFDRGVGATERRSILARYGVTHVLLGKGEGQDLAGLETPHSRIVYSDDLYELRAVGDSP